LEIKEHEILVQLQEKAIEYVKCLYSLSDKIAWLDLFTSHALFAREHRFVKPEINEGKIVEIV
jgi:DNA mismatch repair ATPase MutS